MLRQSDKASYREWGDNKFILFYQMEGVAIWIYAIFDVSSMKMKI